MRKIFALMVVLAALCGYAPSQQAFYHDRALGSTPYQNIVAATPIPYGQVRVCSYPASGSPCTPLATGITDQYGNQVTVQGGNFGQLTTDVTGQWGMGCQYGLYHIQVAATNSNTPQNEYNITCPTVFTQLSNLGTVYQSGPTTEFTGTGAPQTIYTYTLPANTLSSTGGLEITCSVRSDTLGQPLSVAVCIDGLLCGSGTTGDYLTIDGVIPAGAGTETMTLYNNNALNHQWYRATGVGFSANVGYAGTMSVDTQSLSHTISCIGTMANPNTYKGLGFSITRVGL